MLTVLIRYKGSNGSAKRFVDEMVSSGIVEQIRQEEGNLRYEYFFPADEGESVLLVDSWADQEALDKHHKLPLMGKIKELRENTTSIWRRRNTNRSSMKRTRNTLGDEHE